MRHSLLPSTIVSLVLLLASHAGSDPLMWGKTTDQTIATWSTKTQQNAQDEQAWVQLGDAFMQKVRDTADGSYYSRAAAAYQKALALNASNVAALTGMAWVSGGRHDFASSITWAQKAIAIEPQHQAAYGLLGDAALELGDYTAALQHYQKMLDIRPDLSSYSRGAHVLFVTGDARKARILMQKAITAGGSHPEHKAWCQTQLALMLWHTGASLPAEQLLETALAAAPHNAHILAAMGKVKAARQDYHAAIDYYKRANAIAPQLEAIIALSDLYRLTGQLEEAAKQEALVDVMHQLNAANGVRDDIVMARFYADREQRLAEALEIAETVYQTHKNVFVADTLAWAYYKNGRYAEAHQTMQKALAHKTPDAMLLFHAGMIAHKLEERAQAQKYLYQALSLQSNFHPIYATVAADTLEQLGRHQTMSESTEEQ